MKSVELINVSKTFGSYKALDNLNLAIEPGEFLTLLGPSGCGKTTTLNLLAGLLTPDSGEIYIGDTLVNELSPDKRDIAMVFQDYALYPHMSVYENLAFPLRARGRRYAEAKIRAKISEVAALLGIDGLLHRYPREISGGQQQRVALGRAMVRDPKVFLLDEPLSNLDARLRIKMRADLKKLHERIGATIVYVTHDQAEAMTLSTRIAIMNKGVLEQIATPSEIYNRPANVFVANFVGDREINLMNGVVREEKDSLYFVGDEFRFAVDASTDVHDLLREREVIAGVRAEDIELNLNMVNPEDLSGKIHLTELVGPDQIIHVEIGRDAELCCRVTPDFEVDKGQKVYLRFSASKMHFFDPVSLSSLLT